MREILNELLDNIHSERSRALDLVNDAVRKANEALLNTDLALAESVIAKDKNIDQITDDLNEKILGTLALQHPVAIDLRELIASLRIIVTLERMGDLASNICKSVRLRHPNSVVLEAGKPLITEIGNTVSGTIELLKKTLHENDIDAANKIIETDDRIDEIHRKFFQLVRGNNWTGEVEQAVDIALISRFYERIGDHAVSIAKRIKAYNP